MRPDDLPIEALKAGIAAWSSNQDRSYTTALRMVIVEAINAWPGMEVVTEGDYYSLHPGVILLHPQEKNND